MFPKTIDNPNSTKRSVSSTKIDKRSPIYTCSCWISINHLWNICTCKKRVIKLQYCEILVWSNLHRHCSYNARLNSVANSTKRIICCERHTMPSSLCLKSNEILIRNKMEVNFPILLHYQQNILGTLILTLKQTQACNLWWN